MKHYLRYILIGTVLLLSACIGNTIPFPVVKLEIIDVKGEGFTWIDIDPQEHIITLHLEEDADISRVQITAITVTEKAHSSVPLSGVFDLRTPLYVTLSLYQDYEWTIIAEQTIERYFEVQSQIGAAEINVEQLTATAYVPMDTNLNQIEVTRLKLGPAGISTMTPPIDELTSFESVRYVYLTYHDVKETWSLYVIPTDTKVRFTQLDAWSGVIWAYAEGNSSAALGFRYRKTGEETWTTVDGDKITVSGGAFRTCLTGLTPETEYEVVAYSDEDQTETATVTTEAAPLLPNGGFEEWNIFNEVVYPYLSQETAFWDSGNKGAAMGNAIPTNKTTEIRPGSSGEYAAKLESKLAGLAGITKLAAGNLFAGKFAGIRNVTHGIVDFGRPFTQRPTALHGWMKYNQGNLTQVGKVQPPGMSLKVGDPDNGMIYIALGTWTAEEYGVSGGETLGDEQTPICIDTRNPDSFFNPKSPAVIAYGELPLTTTINEWQEFNIPLTYVATDRKPTHLVVVCSASRWGDYFIGSTQSILWVDDFELIYDQVVPQP